jgi:hypothetical protein
MSSLHERVGVCSGTKWSLGCVAEKCPNLTKCLQRNEVPEPELAISLRVGPEPGADNQELRTCGIQVDVV